MEDQVQIPSAHADASNLKRVTDISQHYRIDSWGHGLAARKEKDHSQRKVARGGIRGKSTLQAENKQHFGREESRKERPVLAPIRN
jgi:hypothetical protein